MCLSKSHWCEVALDPLLTFLDLTLIAYDNIKEGLDDGDDEIMDGLDLITIATKRIVFEQVELMHLERSREEPSTNPQPASGKTFSIHKAARDTLGVKAAMNKKGKEVVREESALESESMDQDRDMN